MKLLDKLKWRFNGKPMLKNEAIRSTQQGLRVKSAMKTINALRAN